MKKLHALLRRRAALPLLCYALALAAWLCLGAWGLASDMLARSGGRLCPQTLHAADFALVDLDLTDTALDVETGQPTETLVTTSGDPQMILEDVSAEVVRTMRIYARYDGAAREMCLYYTTRADEPYSQDRRVFPAQQADGSYLYTLPRGRLYALRLDPCSPDEGKTVTLTLEKITLNADAAHYFLPSWYQLFCLALYPALGAAALSWLRAVASVFLRA